MDRKPEGSKFSCSICSFTTETSLEHLNHLTTHIYEKLEYVCPHCDFVSSYRDIVVDHMNIHEQVNVINTQVTQETKPVKRRGRQLKPKETNTEALVSLEDIKKEIKPVRKSGRPGSPAKPKEVKVEPLDLDLEEITKDIKPLNLKNQPRQPKETETKPEEISKGSKPVKKLGLPPKPKEIKIETLEEITSTKEIKPSKRIRRPPKVKEIKTEEVNEIKPVRKRGRPPKPKVLRIDTQEEIAMEIKPIKKRGRPPKLKKIETEELNEIKTVKKRGRSPKPEKITEEKLHVLKKHLEIECSPPKEFNIVSKKGKYSKEITTLEKQYGSPKVIETQVLKSQLAFSKAIKTDNDETINNLTSVPVKPKRVRNNGPFICPVCEKHFRTKQTLKNHTKLNAARIMKCPECDFVCEKTKIMRLHMKSHCGKKFSCEQCAEWFTTRKMKREHLKMNHADIVFPFICRACGYSCDNIVSIKKHIQRFHPREENKAQVATAKHCCPHCTYSTNKKSHHITHLRIHTGERPYKCTACSYGATQSSSLKTHMMRLHPEQTCYKCNHCQASFSAFSDLVKHLKIHQDTKEFTCDICGKHFISEHNLCRHKRLHSLGHTCALCNQMFLYSKAFLSHLKHHDAAVKKIEMEGEGKFPTKGIRSSKATMFETDGSQRVIIGEASASGQTKKFVPCTGENVLSSTADTFNSFSSNENSKAAKPLRNNSKRSSDTNFISAKLERPDGILTNTLVNQNETYVYTDMNNSEKNNGNKKVCKGINKIKPNNHKVSKIYQTDVLDANKKNFYDDRSCVSDNKLLEERIELIDQALSTCLELFLKRRFQTPGAGVANCDFSGPSQL